MATKKITFDPEAGVAYPCDLIMNVGADFKFYITANLYERSKRRNLELKKLRKKTNLSDIVKSLKKRDQSDKNRSRKQGRLIKTKDSRLINTTRLSINEGFLKIKKIIDRS